MRRGNLLTALAVLVVAVLLGAVISSIYALRSDFDDSRGDVSTLRSQLLDLGVQPDAGPPGDAGTSGEKGDPGVDGRDGRDGTDGITPACWFTTAQCIGLTGFDGADSTVPGMQGPAGADSTVPGPAGADGQDGADGAAGADGQPGADSTVPGPQGEPGPPGADGQTPASFSFEWANKTYTCTDDDGDGHFTCTEVLV